MCGVCTVSEGKGRHVGFKMATSGVISYSPNGNFLAVSSPDGRLSLWDTATATISQQYTPSSHLSATCTCLSWCPTRKEPVRKKRRSHKVQRTENDGSAAQVDLVAMGTQAGTILLYSIAKADIHRQMDGGHTDTVSDICWHPDGDTLYSCSEDQHIVEWDIDNSQVKCKWKADTSSVHSIYLCPGSRTLLSAGRMIKLWDLETKKVLKKFTGHASPVTRLKCVPYTAEASDASTSLESVEGLYFVSCADGDRVLNVWHVRSSSKSKSSTASFVVPDDPLDFDILNSSSDQKTYLSVVTKGGEVHIFDPVLNGKAKNHLKACTHLQMTTEGQKERLPTPIPIVATHLLNEAELPLLIAHGSVLKLRFERVSFKSGDRSICLIREDPSSQAVPQVSGEKLKKPVVTGDEAVKTPSTLPHTGYQAAADEHTAADRKSKRKSTRETLTIEDRLVALKVAEAQADMSTQDQSARTGSLVMLLTQGLQSTDRVMLDSVFQQHKESVLKRTIQRLPIPLVVSLVQELTSRMNTTPQSGLVLAHWTRVVLCERASYLMTCPELTKKLSQVYEMINTRTCQASRMTQLHGKLDLMLAQIASQKQREEEEDRPTTAQLVYDEDSSDEGDVMEEPYPMHSDSEGEWEELSEMDHEEVIPIFNDAEPEDSESESSELEEDEEDEDEAEDENEAGEELSSDDDQE